MKYTLILLLLSLVPQDTSKATVYVLEQTRAKTIGRVTFPVYVDEVEVCKLDGGRYVSLALSPGLHSFRSKSKKKGGIELTLAAGQVYYLRLNVEEGGFFLRAAGISSIPKEEGSYSIKQLKPISIKDVKKTDLINQSETAEAKRGKP